MTTHSASNTDADMNGATGGLQIIPITAFETNYIWLIHDGTDAVIVDPGDASPVIAALDAHKLRLSAIVLTHHHHDHTGGVAALLDWAPTSVPVYGPGNESITSVSVPVIDGDSVNIKHPAVNFAVLSVPGHTKGHIAFYAATPGWLFCGDTLFAAGCGRLFEGTPAHMVDSLAKLAALPPATAVYCAHEYTLSNLSFALDIDRHNPALVRRQQAAIELRSNNQPTLPSTIGLELATNPFLRLNNPDIIKCIVAKKHDTNDDRVSVFAAMRLLKDHFKG